MLFVYFIIESRSADWFGCLSFNFLNSSWMPEIFSQTMLRNLYSSLISDADKPALLTIADTGYWAFVSARSTFGFEAVFGAN
jgi:hypothetical protein